MANDKMNAQMSSKDGFIAALDQSGGSTPGALRLYGVADSGIMVQHRLLATHPVGKPILSGGTTGPEGSIFIVAILALVSFIILFTLPRARQDDTTS